MGKFIIKVKGEIWCLSVVSLFIKSSWGYKILDLNQD